MKRLFKLIVGVLFSVALWGGASTSVKADLTDIYDTLLSLENQYQLLIVEKNKHPIGDEEADRMTVIQSAQRISFALKLVDRSLMEIEKHPKSESDLDSKKINRLKDAYLEMRSKYESLRLIHDK